MMGPGFGDGIWRSAVAVFLTAILVAFAFGALAMWGLPKLWAIIKPIIHALTM